MHIAEPCINEGECTVCVAVHMGCIGRGALREKMERQTKRKGKKQQLNFEHSKETG